MCGTCVIDSYEYAFAVRFNILLSPTFFWFVQFFSLDRFVRHTNRNNTKSLLNLEICDPAVHF